MSTYEIGAFTEAELLAQGTAGTNIGYGDVFVMPATTSVVMDVTDNDGTLSGDGRYWGNENATDYSGQTATITENGEVISQGNQIYAECYYWVKDQAGNWYIMIEIEVESENGDYFSFYGDVPPEGSTLTVQCSGNVSCNWVTYDCLMEPNQISPPLALDDASVISETETASLNVLDNDVDLDGGTITVTAVDGGTVGTAFEVNSAEGYSAMVTLNADGSLTVVPGPEFTQLASGETTTISFDYTITDNDGMTSTATVTVEVNGETTLEAADDAIIVSEDETAGDADGNVLANDAIDGEDYTGNVDEVNAEAANVGTWVEGSNGGRIKINADGSFDFDANGDFDALNDGQNADTTFTYQISETGEVVAPHNILFVFDISNSTVGTSGDNQFVGTGVGDVNGDGLSDTVLDAQIAAAKATVQDLLNKGIDPSTVKVGITTFSGVASGFTNVDAATVGTFDLDAAGLISALESIQSGGWTNYEAGLNEAQNWFADNASAGEENVMYFLSDGRPISGLDSHGNYVEQSLADYGDELAAIEADFGASIHAIGVGANSSLDALNEIDNTDGAIQVLSAAEMQAEMLASHDYVVAVDTATVTVTVEGKTDYVAVADTMTVLASEAAGDADLLDGGAASVFDNDQFDANSVTPIVEAVNGDAANVGVAVSGTNGGLLIVNADGTVDFDANGEFNDLLDGQSETTQFTYTTANGQTNSVTVTIDGETVRVANDDVFTVSASESSGDIDASVFANDTQNGGAYTSVVGSVNGELGNVNAFVAGDMGGLIKINADGTIDFDANGEFGYLAEGEVAQTSFSYTLISGEEANVTINIVGEADFVANDDVITVSESATAGDLEGADNGSFSVLANDTLDGVAYSGEVVGAGTVIEGSNGGFATIYADGTIDFDAADQFDYLEDGETAQTSFTYEIEGGETGSVTVNVEGESEPATGGQVINLALMLNSAQSMYAQSQLGTYNIALYDDANGDGLGNQIMDMAYLMLNDFMSDAFDKAADAGATLNLSLISFGGNGNGEGNQFWTINNANSFDGQLQAKISSDNSADLGEGFDNANAWFDDVSTATSTNAVYLISDGLSSGSWTSEYADLVADHNVELDAYLPDISFGGPGLADLNAVDTDGAADLIFSGDQATADLLGAPTYQNALNLDDLLA